MTRIYLSPPHMGDEERRLLLDAFDSNWIAPLGPHVDAFERELAAVVGLEHCAALSSGTAGLHLALIMLGVGPGDLVVTSTLTFAATANAIRYVGAEPVFVDSDLSSWNMDPGLAEEAIRTLVKEGRKPAALVGVDLYGQCMDWDPVVEVCREFEIPVVEDAAEALGARYRGRAAGSLADMSVLSFNGNKIITTSGGGALLSNNAQWVERARFLATQARDPAPHYQHSTLGYNYRLSNLLAAVGRGQLGHLEARVEARRRINARYREGLADLAGVEFMPEAPYGRATFWLTCLTVDPDASGSSSEEIRKALAAEDIEARPVWKPMHLQPFYQGCRLFGGAVSEDLFAKGLCLPSGSSLTAEEQDRVLSVVRDVLSR